MNRRPKVYLNYTHTNRTLMYEIKNALEGNFDLFHDGMLLPGQEWKSKLEEEATLCDVMIHILDEKTAQSKWEQYLTSLAKGAGAEIMPLLRSDHEFDVADALDSIFLDKYRYHLFEMSDQSKSIQQLIEVIPHHADRARQRKQHLCSRWMPPKSKPMFGSPSEDNQFQCDIFMVMPFAKEFQPIYTDHIIPVVEAKSLKIKRGDDFFANHAIMQDVWSALFASKLVIADCTGKNANVFYELGIAHTLGRPVIMITQDIDDIPFDLRHLRIIPYEYTPPGMKQFEVKLTDAMKKLL